MAKRGPKGNKLRIALRLKPETIAAFTLEGERFYQTRMSAALDRAAAAGAKGGIVNELCRRTARKHVLQRHVLDKKERPGPELVDQTVHGRLDVFDDVRVMVRLAELRSKQVLRHGLSYR